MALSCDHLWLNYDTWPEPNSDDLNRCPYCTYIPTRHRGFFRAQLHNLDHYDKVMKDLKCQCGKRNSGRKHSGGQIGHPANNPFHLTETGFPADATEFCPCKMEGQLRDECRFGCKCNKYRLGDTIAYSLDDQVEQPSPSSAETHQEIQ